MSFIPLSSPSSDRILLPPRAVAINSEMKRMLNCLYYTAINTFIAILNLVGMIQTRWKGTHRKKKKWFLLNNFVSWAESRLYRKHCLGSLIPRIKLKFGIHQLIIRIPLVEVRPYGTCMNSERV